MPTIPVVDNCLVAKDPIPLMKCVKMDVASAQTTMLDHRIPLK